MMPIRFAWPLLFGLLLLTACDDPSNVGIGLVDEQGSPELRTFSPSRFESTAPRDVTGGTVRVLAGQVDDPLLGMLAATGYVDFISVFDTTDNPTITGAALRLVPEYVYGDTTLTVTLDLYDLTADWISAGAPADTSLPKGALVTTFDVQPGDTLVTVPLPAAWVTANDTTLRSPTFESSFHGFALEASASSAVRGFDATLSALQVYTNQDTLDYPMSRRLSGLQRLSDPTLPPNRVALQDGVGPILAFDFPFDEAGLEETPLNGAVFRFFADTVSVVTAPPHFVRPVRRRLQLVGVQADSSAFLLAEATVSDEGFLRFKEPLAVNLLSLREVLQRTLFGDKPYDHFELRFGIEPNTLDVILLYDEASGSTAPEALLTISPTGP